MKRRGDWMISSQGRQLWPLDMRAEEVDIEDIAHALSLICRFGGHVKEFYSVSQHSVLVARRFAGRERLAALLHDATEAYCGDMVRPLKQQIPQFKEIEAGIWRAICQRFDINEKLPNAIELAGARMLLTEKRDLVRPHRYQWAYPQCKFPGASPYDFTIEPWSPDRAKREFLALFNKIQREESLCLQIVST